MQLSPLAAFIAAVQGVLVQGHWPQWHTLLYPLLLTTGLYLLGLRLFRRHDRRILTERVQGNFWASRKYDTH